MIKCIAKNKLNDKTAKCKLHAHSQVSADVLKILLPIEMLKDNGMTTEAYLEMIGLSLATQNNLELHQVLLLSLDLPKI
jgi:hypothetical protein